MLADLPSPFVQPPRRSSARRAVGPLLLVTALIAVVLVVTTSSDDHDQRPQPPTPQFAVPALDVAPGSAAPLPGAAVPTQDQVTVRDWAKRVADRTDIPVRTVLAYAAAEVAMLASAPRCHLSWTTLAGVGRVESHHGRFRGTQVRDNGQLSQPIIGVALDGSPGVRAIKDTDRGHLDGDAQWDRAVGHMQFLPATWAKWAVRASGDGNAPDPQDVDDAALAAARYLCASGGDLATAGGWWRAVLTYNESVRYGKDVFSGADAYARAAT
jgi:membrane-bound lytic murein transglycosylase B